MGLYSQTSQGRGLDVTTSPDFTAPHNDPRAERKWHASRHPALTSSSKFSDNISYFTKEEAFESEEEVPCPISLYK